MSASSLWLLNAILAVMMFGISLSLKARDFADVVKSPKGPVTGLVAQFVVMPFVTFLATLWVPMPAEVALGLILVAACPGGSFSNIMTYLAKGNTAMSVSMTAVASAAAAVMTPFNFFFYSELNPATSALLKAIEVPADQIFITVAGVLGIPLLFGLWIAHRYPTFATKSEQFFRFFSLLILFAFVVGALAGNWAKFAGGVDIFLFAVVAHNALALAIGNISAKLMRLCDADQRAITLEVGLQNSGLGLGIIFAFFGDLTSMAIIAAGWGIWHLISGSSLVFYWNWLDKRAKVRAATTADSSGVSHPVSKPVNDKNIEANSHG